MTTPAVDSQIKDAVKSALIEVLAENPEILRGILEEAIEDIGLARAMQAGLNTPLVDEDAILTRLRGKA